MIDDRIRGSEPCVELGPQLVLCTSGRALNRGSIRGGQMIGCIYFYFDMRPKRVSMRMKKLGEMYQQDPAALPSPSTWCSESSP